MHKYAPHECTHEATSELTFPGMDCGSQKRDARRAKRHAQWASTRKKISDFFSIKTSHMFPKLHVEALYLWKEFQMLLRLFQRAVKLKFMEENQ